MQESISAARQAVLSLAEERYGSEPDYPWESYPENMVLRRADNRKWYAALLRAPRHSLGLPGEGTIDVLNVKCDPAASGSLRLHPGVCPAYHMNKTHWVSILLDGTVELPFIAVLLDQSYDLAGGASKR